MLKSHAHHFHRPGSVHSDSHICAAYGVEKSQGTLALGLSDGASFQARGLGECLCGFQDSLGYFCCANKILGGKFPSRTVEGGEEEVLSTGRGIQEGKKGWATLEALVFFNQPWAWPQGGVTAKNSGLPRGGARAKSQNHCYQKGFCGWEVKLVDQVLLNYLYPRCASAAAMV